LELQQELHNLEQRYVERRRDQQQQHQQRLQELVRVLQEEEQAAMRVRNRASQAQYKFLLLQ
jgi:hypothetical protein